MINCSRTLQGILIFALIVFAAASQGDAWIGWSLGVAVFTTLLIVDCMFFNEGSFVYEPSHEVRCEC